MKNIDAKSAIQQKAHIMRNYPPARIIEIRKEFGLSQADFGRLLGGVGRNTINAWERAEEPIPSVAQGAYNMLLHMKDKRYGLCLLDWLDKC